MVTGRVERDPARRRRAMRTLHGGEPGAGRIARGCARPLVDREGGAPRDGAEDDGRSPALTLLPAGRARLPRGTRYRMEDGPDRLSQAHFLQDDPGGRGHGPGCRVLRVRARGRRVALPRTRRALTTPAGASRAPARTRPFRSRNPAPAAALVARSSGVGLGVTAAAMPLHRRGA